MNRQQFRKAQRARTRKTQRDIAKKLGLPKGFLQFASRHGALPEDVRNERLKYA